MVWHSGLGRYGELCGCNGHNISRIEVVEGEVESETRLMIYLYMVGLSISTGLSNSYRKENTLHNLRRGLKMN